MSQKDEHPVRDMIFSDLGKIAKVLGAVAGTVGAAVLTSESQSAVTDEDNLEARLHDPIHANDPINDWYEEKDDDYNAWY